MLITSTADLALGIRAAARTLNLDFIPLALEQYELIIPQEQYNSNLLQPLLALLHNDQFKTTVSAMPGYHIESLGQTRTL